MKKNKQDKYFIFEKTLEQDSQTQQVKSSNNQVNWELWWQLMS